jgi:aspartyl-tRNA(Asn)/glutamyl-tRNA(Gln) amidotransferase subunit B
VALRDVMLYIGVSDVKMHEGSLRCDANVSIRPLGTKELGTKTEIKNMNSFKSVVAALEHEISRQHACVASGERIVQETRGWDEVRGLTYSMRSKEQAHDYRYFPDPDLPPLSLDEATLASWRSELPELPAQRRERFITQYGIPQYDANVLTQSRFDADYFEAVASASGDPKQASNWLMGDVRKSLEAHGLTLSTSKMTPAALGELISMVKGGAITGRAAKEVCDVLVAAGGDPKAIVEQRGLAQVSDESAIVAIVDKVIAAQAESVAAYKGGKAKALDFIVGQVMRESRGRANVDVVKRLLMERLG